MKALRPVEGLEEKRFHFRVWKKRKSFPDAGAHQPGADNRVGDGAAGADEAGQSVAGAEAGAGKADAGGEGGFEEDVTVLQGGAWRGICRSWQGGNRAEQGGFEHRFEVGRTFHRGPGFKKLGDRIHAAGGGPE